MLDLTNNRGRLVYIDRLLDRYQQHPNMRQVAILKDKLKREKQQDWLFYQSIKEKIATSK